MLDLTREIILEPKSLKTYRVLQVFLYLTAALAALYLSYLIIFPHKNFFFSFADPASRNNNIDMPRLGSGEILEGQEISAGQNLLLYTDIASNYSFAKVILNMSDSKAPADINISIRRSFEAFMYPSDVPIGFRTGTLLRNNGNFYIVSDSKLRKFSDRSLISRLGYNENAFQEVSENELAYNQRGADIDASGSYPDDTLFRISDNYYVLKNQTLQKFVSDQAYTSKYDAAQAIIKDVDFLSAYPSTEELAGFAEGSLISNADSVFIVSGGQIWPIDNPVTFLNKGYDWNDVMQAGEDELSIYQKAKLFNITTAHPDGTVFQAGDTGIFYMVENGKKRPLPGKISASWLKKHPVMVSDRALEMHADCSLKASYWNKSAYSCSIPLEKFADLIGYSYEFSVISSHFPAQLDSVTIDFKKNIDKNNFKSFALNLYNSIKSRYVSS